MARLKYEDIQKEIQLEGWILQSKEYVNLKTDLELICPNGHLNVFSLEQWRRHKSCPICENNKYANVDSQPVKKNGYRVLAFDQASITSGWSVFDDKELVKYFGKDVLETPAGKEALFKLFLDNLDYTVLTECIEDYVCEPHIKLPLYD